MTNAAMTDTKAHFFFDFIDPLSYLVTLELAEVEGRPPEIIAWIAFELRPPPMPLTTIGDPSLAGRWTLAREKAQRSGVAFGPPELVPWTRKAHELALYAESSGVGEAVRTRIFEAYLLEGMDIGRVDVLVGIGREAGLDATETKVVLDVDRFEAAVLDARAGARSTGVTSAPTIVRGAARLEGFHNRTTLGTFLRA